MKIQFYLTKDINKAGEKPIRASISIKGTRLQKLRHSIKSDGFGFVQF